MVEYHWSTAHFALCVALVGCEGHINPPTPIQVTPAGNGGAVFGPQSPCPTLPPVLGDCGDLHFIKAVLTCGGNGGISLPAPTSMSGGGLRVTGQLYNGSQISGQVITPGVGCKDTDGIPLVLHFGVTYTADQGTEPSGVACITQSKADFSEIWFDNPFANPWIPLVRDLIQKQLDQYVINFIWGTPGTTLAGRCSRWREWSQCGNGTKEGNEICDDGNILAGDGCNPQCSGP
jgi:cysteine-rich repeat protein